MEKITISKIYLDLDGVMANFDKRIQELSGKSADELEDIHPKELWKIVKQDDGFFENLEMMPDAKLLWDTVKNYDVEILTGLPLPPLFKRSDKEKRNWVKKHLIPNPPVITTYSREKLKYSKPGHLLIDDRVKNIKEWESKGGHGILVKNNIQAIKELKEKYIL